MPTLDDFEMPNDTASFERSEKPVLMEKAFNVEEICGGPASGWVNMLNSMVDRLPVHLHFEPKVIGEAGGPPIFHRTLEMLTKFPALAEMCSPGTDSKGHPKRARIKMRLSAKGKFIHRNRYRRNNIVCCLNGEAHWLFIDSHGGKADEYLASQTNDNWNGFRSERFPTTLSLEEMEEIVRTVPEGVTAYVAKIQAGDVMTFDGRWWHATTYEKPVLNMFFTPGKDMEVAVREHHRRMKMPLQENLRIAAINMAKCARLSDDWQKSVNGEDMNWSQR